MQTDNEDDVLANADRGDDFKPTENGDPSAEEKVTSAEGAEEKAGEESKEEGKETDKLAQAENDDEGEETPEEKAERERLEAEEAKRRNIRIPKSRFDEAQAKARAREAALLEEIEKLKGGQQESEVRKNIENMQARVEELQDKYEDLILDGRKDEARKVRREVDSMRQELFDYQTSMKSDAARRSAVEELSYNAKLASFEAQYPALNPENDSFDEDKTSEVATLLTAFANNGMPRADALAKAVKYVMGPPATKQQESSSAADLANERAKKARAAAAAANTKQPPSTNTVGLPSDRDGKTESTIDVMRMSQDRFAKLDEETLAKMRGDDI